MFERHAPSSIEPIEAVTDVTMGVGASAGQVTPQLLDVMTEAYREAAK